VKILLCADEAPIEPTASGFRRAVAGLVHELERHHDVRVLAFRKPDQVGSPVPSNVRVVEWPTSGPVSKMRLLAAAVIERRPLRTAELPALLAEPLREELEGFAPDVVQVTPARLARLRASLGDRPTVLMAMDAWHLNVRAKIDVAGRMRGAFLRSEERRIRRAGSTAYRGYDRVVVSSRDDGEAIRTLDPTLSFSVIPIGVDAGAWPAEEPSSQVPPRIVFHGVMSYPPNVVAAEYLVGRVLPLVRAERPEATVALVGRDPAPAVLRLAEIPGVEVTGAVSEIGPWLRGSRVWAGPFVSATGIKTKVLEAMACSLPCVVTPLGTRGLELEPGAEVLVGSDPPELARHLLALLDDPDLAARIGRAARARVLRSYDWPAVRGAYERVYEDILGRRVDARSAAADG
jgi:glycosyltransferase involved in cell wall biosynthesis